MVFWHGGGQVSLASLGQQTNKKYPVENTLNIMDESIFPNQNVLKACNPFLANAIQWKIHWTQIKISFFEERYHGSVV